MSVCIALLRGVNVGGNSIISMPRLRDAFVHAGYADTRTYINSGNMLFSSEKSTEELQRICRDIISKTSGLDVAVAVLTAEELADALANAPEWWNKQDDSKHNAIFVIPPATADSVCEEVGEIKPEYEKIYCHGKVIFWTAPIKTFSRTRWSRTSKLPVYQQITIRNANTAITLSRLAAGK